MNARLIEKATTLKTTKGESQNAFKRINQAKVSAIRLTHTGREVSPSGLKPNSRKRPPLARRAEPLGTMALHWKTPPLKRRVELLGTIALHGKALV